MAINNKTLTNANSILRIQVPNLYDNWITVTGFQADNRTGAAARTVGETRMGVDGILSGGAVFNSQPFEIYLEPNSPQMEIFREIFRDVDTNGEIRQVNIEQTNVSVSRTVSMSGYPISGNTISTGAKLLNGETFTFEVDRAVEKDI